MIFDELTGYYGAKRDMPRIAWRLDERNSLAFGINYSSSNMIIIYKPDQAPTAIETLVHELSHPWIEDETLNTLSTEENLIRIAAQYGKEYIKNPSDTASGRSACLYGLAANKGFVDSWAGIAIYLDGDGIAKPTSNLYYDFLEYYLLPGLMMRYTALNDSVIKPVIDTDSSYTIDLSETQRLLRDFLSPKGEATEPFPFGFP